MSVDEALPVRTNSRPPSQLLEHTDSPLCQGCSDETSDLDGWPNRCACGGWRHARLDICMVKATDITPAVIWWCSSCQTVEAVPGR
jgi:hypothetical protein